MSSGIGSFSVEIGDAADITGRSSGIENRSVGAA